MKPITLAFAHRIQNEQPLLRAELLSDLHIGWSHKTSSLKQALESIWKRKVRYVLLGGDLSANGFFWQQKKVFDTLEEFPIQYAIALGNHDTYRGKHVHKIKIHPHYRSYYAMHPTQLYYDTWMQGVHVYVLNSEHPRKDGIWISSKQKNWLLSTLKKDAPETLSILLVHHPLQNTHPHTDDPHNTVSLAQLHPEELHNAHTRILYISGHTHIAYMQSLPLYKDGICFLNLPSFIKPDTKDDEGEKGLQLQVYTDFLYVRCRDYQQDRWITSHEFIIDMAKQCVYPYDAQPLQNTKLQSS